MPITHSFKILMCNLKLTIKVALYILIVLVVFISIVTAIVMPLLEEIIQLINETNINPAEFLNHPFHTTRTEFIQPIWEIIRNEVGVGRFIGLSLLTIFLLSFVVNLVKLPVTKIIYGKMSTSYEDSFIRTFISLLGKSVIYSLFASMVTTAIISLFAVVSYYSLFWLIQVRYIIFIPIILLAYMLLVSLVKSIFAFILPAICSENCNLKKGLKKSFKGILKKFSKNFLCNLASFFIFASIISTTALPSFGLIPIIMISVYIVFGTTLNNILFFTYNKKKYYTDNSGDTYEPGNKFEK